MVVHAFNPHWYEAEAGKSLFWSEPGLEREQQDSQVYRKKHLLKKQMNKKRVIELNREFSKG